jgi:hypothetical protein
LAGGEVAQGEWEYIREGVRYGRKSNRNEEGRKRKSREEKRKCKATKSIKINGRPSECK